ncbi:GT2 family glycosyltransferase [Cryobacterium sp. CAN_C3]|uniref:glycosyltransferase family 2 protein n=1 Tax=unclassified Cryobacterium TaxID=2649013 RepID=UPI0018CAD27C|nr:glycosyltransferase family 2 protein [Cryobacterium sp. CAN_C3]MEC5155936.1 GT2 family glycosyltransferase [Cryobacterium sp. CAN_C3]
MKQLHVIMACHNRRDLTVGSIRSAIAAAETAHVNVDFTVYDDGSTDGSSAALSEMGADITVLSGDGSAYWARSMARAELDVWSRPVSQQSSESWIVWLNDDVILDTTAFHDLDAMAVNTVYIGAMRDGDTGDITYGGLKKTGWHPLGFSTVAPGPLLIPLDSFNGNLVFVSMPTAIQLGGIDGEYSHSLADIDYGLRCGRLNIPALLLPVSRGVCARNSPEPRDGVRRQWRRFVGLKGGGHYASLTRIIKKGAQRKWPLYVYATYILWWARHLISSVKARYQNGES